MRPTTTDLNEPIKYYPALDWLRGVLAVVVMLGHDSVITWQYAGAFAVSVFFALSGWLIGGILLNLTRADLPQFFFNRAIRIWIPYFLGLFFLLFASSLRDSLSSKWLEIVFYKVSFVYNIFGTEQLATFVEEMPLRGTGNHFWSVNAEEQFYLLAPLLLVLGVRYAGQSALVWGILAVFAWYTEYYSAIVFGVFAAVMVHRYGAWHSGYTARLILCAAVFISGWVMITGMLPYQKIAPICSIAIVLALAVPAANSSLGTLVGGMSYQLYLNHWIGVFVANALLSPIGLRDTSWRRALAAVLSIVLAIALYWWIDRRLRKRREALYTPQRGKIVLTIGYVVVACGLIFGWVTSRYR